MPCLLVALALVLPRLVIVLLWFFSAWFQGVFDSLLWPVLGFVFLPTTLLWYSAVVNWYQGIWSLVPVAGLVLALLLDLSPSRHASTRERARVA